MELVPMANEHDKKSCWLGRGFSVGAKGDVFWVF